MMAEQVKRPISEEECWELLKTETVGRFVVSHDGFPNIYPVNYVTDGSAIYFRTALGEKVEDLRATPQVGFQVESIKGDTGWSIAMRGMAEEMGPDGLQLVEDLGLKPWVAGHKPIVVKIDPVSVKGSRFTFHRAKREF